jgi:hypothetical protein
MNPTSHPAEPLDYFLPSGLLVVGQVDRAGTRRYGLDASSKARPAPPFEGVARARDPNQEVTVAEFKHDRSAQPYETAKSASSRDEIVEDLDIEQANPEGQERVKGGTPPGPNQIPPGPSNVAREITITKVMD